MKTNLRFSAFKTNFIDSENLFFLIPIAAGVTGDTEEIRETYFQQIVARFEERTGEQILNSIVYKTS